MPGEFALIREYFQRDLKTDAQQDVLLGIGDDCALLAPPVGLLAISVDTLVAGVHFPLESSAGDIAQRALRTNLSDLAAMGACPKWFTLALTLPDSDEGWLREFSRELFACADEYHIALIGGDTTRGPLSITIQVMGETPPGAALRRDGASADDFVFVTNTLGDGAAALALLESRTAFEDAHAEYLRNRFYRPEPQLEAALKLRHIASAALDISDGLVADCAHICAASGVGAVLDVEALPLSEAVQSLPLEVAREYALSGGDDYQLCFTVPPENMPELAMLIARGELQATLIGRMVVGAGVQLLLDGEPFFVARKGFEHF